MASPRPSSGPDEPSWSPREWGRAMSERRYDVAVVGAGIVGSACAMELARGGRSVVLLEAVDVASDTSCRAMGHVGVYDNSEDQVVLTRFARGLWGAAAADRRPVGYKSRRAGPTCTGV